jgi:hypothetical protein
MLKKLGFILAACLASGCATVPQPLGKSLPDYSGVAKAAPEARTALYQALSIKEHQGTYGLIGPNWYAIPDLKQACVDIQAKDARHAFNRAFVQHLVKDIIPPSSAGLATLLGAYVGALVYVGQSETYYTKDSNGNYTQQWDYSKANSWDVPIGLAGGAVLGTLVWWLTDKMVARSESRYMDIAVTDYNKDLRKALQLELAPQPGGAKAGVDLKF